MHTTTHTTTTAVSAIAGCSFSHRTPKKKLRKHAIEQFLWSQSAVPNSVYKPMDDQGRRCRTSTVKYYSLASLVWECCDIANLLDLYTFFCSSRLLVAKAPHSSTGSKSREKHGTGCGIPRAEKNMAWHRLGVFSVRLEKKHIVCRTLMA